MEASRALRGLEGIPVRIRSISACRLSALRPVMNSRNSPQVTGNRATNRSWVRRFFCWPPAAASPPKMNGPPATNSNPSGTSEAPYRLTSCSHSSPRSIRKGTRRSRDGSPSAPHVNLAIQLPRGSASRVTGVLPADRHSPGIRRRSLSSYFAIETSIPAISSRGQSGRCPYRRIPAGVRQRGTGRSLSVSVSPGHGRPARHATVASLSYSTPHPASRTGCRHPHVHRNVRNVNRPPASRRAPYFPDRS